MRRDDELKNDRTLLSRLERLHPALVRFEASWRAGERPQIEAYIEGYEGPERSLLLRELMGLEIELGRGAGRPPDPDDYRRRFAGDSTLVDQVFHGARWPRQPQAGDLADVLSSFDDVARICEDVETESGPGPSEREAIRPLPEDGSQQERQKANIRDVPRVGGTEPEPDHGGIESQHQFTVTQSLFKSTGSNKQFGRYRLLRVLGQGAFGRVHLAFDEELKRQVAIKEPNPERFQHSGDCELYLAEARTAATLDHPNLVPVYDVGRTAEGSVYVVSKFIQGRTLAEHLDERLTADEASRLVATVSRALHHAHRKRLVHRDVKPANILIEDATGTPYVADFGLAISEEASLAERNIAGTPSYMSPEQVRGEGHRLGGRSDIFSLGVIFYELLTGKRPFRCNTMMEIFHQVTSADPPSPRTLDEAIPPELERICLKALAKRASDRYATALEMAEDLMQWRKGPRTSLRQVTVIPRGLRSFGPDDADFFLDLLPGTRGRDGLPESIWFWKVRIEEADPDKTFDVGLIYGPSGCGKSSLVKAGLLPHLSKSIVAVYVEATADDTETRVLRGLRKRLPMLPEDLGLVDSFMLLRRSGLGDGHKVVVVMDQFEQWLHARRAEAETDLVHALRQCDGGKLQAIVMVRDDFSMAASRFMRELETPILEGHNFATVDLFDDSHAMKVLTKFGQAFGKLSAQSGNMNAAEREFLRSVVSGLAQDGKVVSVRLALFAEMVKDKPWVPATLDEVGGTEGIGVNFLEETFSSRKANPEHRHHQHAARQVLKALLPEIGTDIKGYMRSQAELLETSGYVTSPAAFRDLIRILDGALRLITPTDPDGSRSNSGSDPGTKFYPLTHDYLVPSLREWLTRKQKETRQGRAELRLAELAALWNAKPENRRLPSWNDYRTIRRFVAPTDWTKGQRTMMQQAELYHAQALVRRLLEVNLRDVPAIVDQVRQLRKYCVPLLRKEQQAAAEPSPAKLHTALALLPLDESQIDYLYEQLLQAEAADFPVLRDTLAVHREMLSARLWKDAASGDSEERRFRAAAALASYEPAHPGWGEIREATARSLTLVKPEYLGDWKGALRPVQSELLSPLSAIFRDRELGELQRALATSALTDYAADDVGLLTDLIEDADPQQFHELFSVLAQHGKAAIEVLEREMERVVTPDWGDAPLNPAWCEVTAELRRVLESAAGMVEQRFVLCQTLPFALLHEVIMQLGRCGYRPRCIRPYCVGASLMVAAIWTRDDRAWQWLDNADPDAVLKRDGELRMQGFVPIDASVHIGSESEPRYTVTWEQAIGDDTEVRLLAGPLGEAKKRSLTTLIEEKFNCQSGHIALDNHGRLHCASLWTRRRNQQKSTTRLFHGLAEKFRDDDCPGLLLSDARLTWGDAEEEELRSRVLLTTAVWNVSTLLESKTLHGLSVVEQRFLGPHLAADNYRPAVISVAAGPDHGLPVAVTVWHRPLVPEEAKDRLARRQANSAVALLKLECERKVWPML
jgi:serine/threonine protein kinase